MARWFTLTSDHLKAAGHGDIIERAEALAVGGVSPTAEAIANAIARIQRAIAPGNVLDIDPTKIPASFKGVAEKLALYDLMERIRLRLTPEQVEKLKTINSDLNRTADNQLKVEQPDTPAPTETIQPSGMKISAVNVPCRMTGRGRTSGL